MLRGAARRSSLTRSEKGASHNPFSRRTNNAAEIVSAERGFSGRWKMVSQATFSLSRCERSGLQCEGMSLSGQPWMALCKWQPGPFSHSSQLLQPLTSQRQEQLAQPVPEEKSIQSLQPDPHRKLFRDNEIGALVPDSSVPRVLVVRIVTFTTCLTIMIRILNVTVVKIMWTTPTAANSRNSWAFRGTTVLPENRVGSAAAGNPPSIALRIRHSVASARCCWYRLSIRNRGWR